MKFGLSALALDIPQSSVQQAQNAKAAIVNRSHDGLLQPSVNPVFVITD